MKDKKMRFFQLLRTPWLVVFLIGCILYILIIRSILSSWTRMEYTMSLKPNHQPLTIEETQLKTPNRHAVPEAILNTDVALLADQPKVQGEQGVCPTVYAQEMISYLTDTKGRIPSDKHIVDCAAVIKADVKGGLAQLERCTPQQTPTPQQYHRILNDGCDTFMELRGYSNPGEFIKGHSPDEQLREQVRDEERQFPLAFILLTDGRLEQTERLLRAIYRPHNVYCVYYSGLTPAVVQEALELMTSCFNNVFLLGDEIYNSPLEGDMICMKELLQRPEQWKYLLNLQSREFPLKTNLELVRILKAYKGGNDMQSQASGGWAGEALQETTIPTLRGMTLYKGSGSIAASRDFIHFAIHNNVAADLLAWLKERNLHEHHFYSTLNRNPIKGAPGAFYGKQHKSSLIRVVVPDTEDTVCAGQGNELVCSYGLADLHHLSQAPQLFAHKVYIELSPLTLTCLEQWHRNRSAMNQVGTGFNQELYDKVPWALYHV